MDKWGSFPRSSQTGYVSSPDCLMGTRGVKLTVQLNLVSLLRMRGATPPLPNTSSWRGDERSARKTFIGTISDTKLGLYIYGYEMPSCYATLGVSSMGTEALHLAQLIDIFTVSSTTALVDGGRENCRSYRDLKSVL